MRLIWKIIKGIFKIIAILFAAVLVINIVHNTKVRSNYKYKT